jgi:lipopolysaccharide transport system ATP-binding protein
MTGSWAIEARGLGKRYRIGTAAPRPDSLRDLIGTALATPLRNFRRVRRLTTFDAAPRTGTHDTIWALRDASFTVAHGEVLGVIGRNGAGKSTLLKVLCRITEPTAGSAVLRGRVGSLLEVGTGFHPDLTGRENVYLNGAILGMDHRHVARSFDEIVEFAGVERFIDTPVKRYSSGMYLRLAFAVAAHLEPDILIVDEVLAVGDAQFQKKCLGTMRRVSEEGRTVVFVSHNLAAVRSLCSRALLLRDGGIVADEPAAAAVARYLAQVNERIALRQWADPATAPQNGSIRLDRIGIRATDGDALGEVTTDTSFRIDIDYTTKRADVPVGLTVYMFDAENRCILTSVNNREPQWYGRPMPQGRFRTSCHVPGRVLNAGVVSISVNMFGANFTDNCQIDDALRLEIADGAALRNDYFGPFFGLVRPDWEWTTEPLATSGDE